MADPLSTVAGVVGVIGFALHGAKRLYELIDGIQGAPQDIADISTDLKALYEVLGTLASMRESSERLGPLYYCLEAPLENCVEVFEEFTTTLYNHTHTTRNDSKRKRIWSNVLWTFKEKEIKLLRDTLLTYKASLDLAVGAMNFVQTTSIDERTRRMEENLKNDMDFIRSKLSTLNTERDELASLVGRRGSEWQGTDTGYAIKKFLDYTGTLYGSPPDSLSNSPKLVASDIVIYDGEESIRDGQCYEDDLLLNREIGDNGQEQNGPSDNTKQEDQRAIAYDWNPKFVTRRDLDYSVENKPYIVARAELWGEDSEGSCAESDEEESVVRTFMRGSDESNACLHQADKVEALCFGASLESLQAEEREASELPVAWLDERSFATGKGRSRSYRGPLTARELYKELKKPRFRYAGTTSLATAGNFPNPNMSEGQDEEPDAERRLIFITDLDRWSIYALIGTASYYQAFALRDAIYKHLAFENFIGVTFPPQGLAMFQLAFHLPYYVWRSSEKPRKDHRQDANGNPLREFRDVSFLTRKSSWSSGFLYEAQISCVVAGSDEWRWVAYCFVDTYFDTVEEGKESVQSYHEDSLAEEGMRVDPFTFGEKAADNQLQKPQDYFLTVFQIRVAQVEREWQQLVTKVQQSIREYVQNHHSSLSVLKERSSFKEAKDNNEMVWKSHEWIAQVRLLSRQLSQDLSKTVHACERFYLKHSVYFRNLSESTNGHLSLATIQTTFDELESLKKTLESLTARCDDFIRDLELHLILENVEVGNRQQKVAEDNKGLSVIMMFFLPLKLMEAIVSMNKGVIAFIHASLGLFIGLLSLFGVLGIAINAAQLYQTLMLASGHGFGRAKALE